MAAVPPRLWSTQAWLLGRRLDCYLCRVCLPRQTTEDTIPTSPDPLLKISVYPTLTKNKMDRRDGLSHSIYRQMKKIISFIVIWGLFYCYMVLQGFHSLKKKSLAFPTPRWTFFPSWQHYNNTGFELVTVWLFIYVRGVLFLFVVTGLSQTTDLKRQVLDLWVEKPLGWKNPFPGRTYQIHLHSQQWQNHSYKGATKSFYGLGSAQQWETILRVTALERLRITSIKLEGKKKKLQIKSHVIP